MAVFRRILTNWTTQHLLINLVSPGSRVIVIPDDFGLEDAEQLHGQIDRPAPLPGCHPHLRSRKLARERSHEDLVLIRKRRQHNVLHGCVQLFQKLSPSNTMTIIPTSLRDMHKFYT